MSTIVWSDRLAAEDIAGVDALVHRVNDADGVSPLSEHAYLLLQDGGGHGDQHALVRAGGRIVGYAQVSGDVAPQAELLVDPAFRGRGLGRDLTEALLEVGGASVQVWSHGDLPAAASLAKSAGLVQVRRLCRYVRPLDEVPDVALPQGVQLRAFEARDTDAWLALNAEIFVDLPDQGGWTEVDLQRRLAQSWFDPDGFLIATDAQGMAGFHWTKVHSDADGPAMGEVYVLGVAGRARGTGLGAALTSAGLQHLKEQGLSTVMLFVDASNTRAVSLYTGMGFVRDHCDVQYGAA